MASVNDYLKKLLYQYDCVVVPELGAFLTHYQPASFTEASGLYLPPRKRVAFNEALRLDDGILANYIMLHEPVTREGAQRHISSFVNELRQQVETTGRFELEGIGTFTYNDEGRLQFGPSLRHNFFGESYGLSPVSVQSVAKQSLQESSIEAVPVTTALGPVKVQEDVTLTPYRPSRPYWRVAAIALLVGSLGAFSYFSVLEPGQPFQSSLDPANLFRFTTWLMDRPAKTTEAVPKATSVKKPAPAPVAHAQIEQTASVKPAPVEPTPVSVNEVTTKPEPARSSDNKEKLSVATVTKVEAVAKPEVAIATVKPQPTGPHFTVIAGVFLSKQNALRLRRQLRKAGYTDAFIIMPETGEKERYKVAAAGSAIRSEAVAKMAAIDSLAGTESWILKN
ncbi:MULTISPECIES: SPOR domain-containing protein [unclassified Spirosoma]|uniref:HU domain-containing protein n=1 Tax=unclassified Spirosoma TaxID=2621999 RepID=UPI000966D34E|nr:MULTISPECIES: SPOR domain-containing protein [unclassified Spirosoma]MBN8820830.1 SPOR domain-containing protein [Spirosoma sp.]OJW71574.1 MAG: sporulation protein [Spirosoma sp. 48-14]